MSELKTENTSELIINSDKFVPYISESTIQERIFDLATQINKDYAGRTPIFIGILNGAFIFMSDLIKNITGDREIDFFKLSSYGDSKISSGKVTKLKDLNCEVTERDLIIVEDIVDSGLSINYIRQILEPMEPASLKVAALLVKRESIKYETKIDYIGFEIDNKFVVGYGLDYAQKYRNLRSIFVLSEEEKD